MGQLSFGLVLFITGQNSQKTIDEQLLSFGLVLFFGLIFEPVMMNSHSHVKNVALPHDDRLMVQIVFFSKI